ARPEVLYYLAADVDASVRAAVAGNEATPVQADLVLARDREPEVRVDLAAKIARLAPGLSREAHERLRKMTYDVLDILVRDQVTRVRQVIAETLKDVADAPPEIIQRLARDYEIAVAGPVLQFSPLLSDADLLEIIGGKPIAGAVEAVARRHQLREAVTDAIGASGDTAAITALLENKSAQIREETLDRLVDRAPGVIAWHRPLVSRPILPGGAALKLARFVAANLLDMLRARRDLDPETTQEVSTIVMRRLSEEGLVAAAPEKDKAPAAPSIDAALERARRLQAAGTLNDEAVTSALHQGDRSFVRAALSLLADLPVEGVDRVLGAHSAKGIVALAWKAGLTMPTAVRLQIVVGHIVQPALVKPRVDGGYPMSEEAMRWQLEFLTGETLAVAAK
ncbi:MAG: DUF2336 domain-containing protein, partial [Alphaproteobacteria bacterium]|nr:DUF2336 domain-containing protein [Alphaproteobacteria bacterium]